MSFTVISPFDNQPADPHDLSILRELAKELAEIAALPIQSERAELWRSLNSLSPKRAAILVEAQGGWDQLVPDSVLKCRDIGFRSWELVIRRRIWAFHNIPDDKPVTNNFDVWWWVQKSDYGVAEVQHRTAEKGSYSWDAPIKSIDDLSKLKPRTITVDHEMSKKSLEFAQNIFGDILNVRFRGEPTFRCMLSRVLIHLRGLEQMMVDMYDNPELLHQTMTFLRDDMLNEWETFEKEGILTLNNEPDQLLGTGGLACTDELPADDFDGKVRLKDLVAWGESQETTCVGPEQFNEFVLQYQIPLLKRFGLVNYGCCEPLDRKFDLLTENLPNLRWVAVSPWCNREIAAEKLGNRYVYVYKPNPSRICSPEPNFEAAEQELRETLDIARGCCVSITMKDTQTFHNQPERITRWAEMARRIAEEYA